MPRSGAAQGIEKGFHFLGILATLGGNTSPVNMLIERGV